MPSNALAKKAYTLVGSQKRALIYLYDGRMVWLFFASSSWKAIGSTKTCLSLYGTKLRHPDYTTIM